MNRIFRFFHSETSGIHQAAYLLAFFSFFSQILALFRDRLLAGIFGASSSLDIYYAAFRIPDFIFATVGSMVSISILIPFLTRWGESDNEKTKKFLDSMLSGFSLIMIVVCGITFVIIPYLVAFILPGINDPKNVQELINITRILLLSPLFLGFSNLLATITQMHKRFFLYSLSPIVYNLSIMVGAAFLSTRFGIYGVIFGVVFGCLLHFAIQIPYIFEKGLLPRFTFHLDFSDIKAVSLLSIPRTIALSASNIALIFITSFASLMSVGSIAIFNFSINLQSVPLSIIGVSYASAAFPVLALLYSTGETKKFVDQTVTAARHILFLSLPVTTLFIVLRAQIVRTILETECLIGLILGLPLHALLYFLYHSLLRNWTFCSLEHTTQQVIPENLYI